MALVVVFVDVLVVGVEGVVIKIEIGVGVRRALPCFRDRKVLGVEDLGFGMALVFWIGNRQRPVVAIAADGADDLLFRDNLEDAGQVPDEPLLAGDGTGIAGGLVLIVVHEDDPVGVGGDEFEIGVGGGDGGVDPETEVAGVQFGIKLLDEAHISRGSDVGKAFKVERETAIGGICGEEAKNLAAQRGAFGWVFQNVAKARVPALVVRVVVVQVRKDFRVFL